VQDIRAPRPEQRLPVVLSFEEVHRFFVAIPPFKRRTLLMTAYAAGLRVSEAASLRVSDIDSQRRVIRVVEGKRKKDRYTVLSPLLLQMLRHYWWPDDRKTIYFQVAGRPDASHSAPCSGPAWKPNAKPASARK
jgi:integrase